ncbi:MAG: hypothetical protein IJW25_02415, partial [Clostridia bacterium]|nr:hypothetical protein [Clostridia bacterium]
MANYLFIDMHLHSSYSDEDLCDESPAHILSKVQSYMDKYNSVYGGNAKCLVSIADHNSILASKVCAQLKKSGKFPNVDVISGCEFTIDLKEINQALNLDKGFTRCHLLGYNFNPEDKELIAYSKVTHKRFSNEDNIGLQICAAKRAICEKYNTDIPFSEFETLANFKQDQDFFKGFMEIVKNNLSKKGISYKVEDLNLITRMYGLDPYRYVEEATCNGRLKLSEAMKLINNAGGTLSLAHPATLKLHTSALEFLLNKNGLPGNQIASGLPVKKNRVDIFKLPHEYAEIVLKEFVYYSNQIGGNAKIECMEVYNAINNLKRFDKVIISVCKSNNLFATAGSDYHGENFTSHKTIGNVFQQQLQKLYGQTKSKMQDRELFIRVSSLPVVNKFIGDKYSTNYDLPRFIDEKGNEINWLEIDNLINKCLSGREQAVEQASKQSKENQQEKQTMLLEKQQLISRINNLSKVAFLYDKILDKEVDIDTRRKLAIKLDLFCHSIYKGLKALQTNIREHADYYSPKHIKKITTLLKEIHRKYYELVRLDKDIMPYIEETIKKQYRKNETSIDRVANITIR